MRFCSGRILWNKRQPSARRRRDTASANPPFNDVSDRLRTVDRDLFNKVRVVLDENKAERHIRGGIATQKKYLLEREKEKEVSE